MRKALLLAVICSIGAAALVARAGGTSTSTAPTYYRDVAPILDSKCASCHRLGGIAPFALTSAADARSHAAGIVQHDESRLDAALDAGRRLRADHRSRQAPADGDRAADARALDRGRRAGG